MKKLNYFSAMLFLSKYIKKYIKNFIMFYLGWLFDTVLSIVLPILFGIMIDEIVYYQNTSGFIRISIVFVIMSTASCILYFLIYAQHHYLMNMYTMEIKKDIFDHLLVCDAGYMSDSQTGDIISTLHYYSSECMHFVIRNIIHTVNSIISIAVILAYLFIINPAIGFFALTAAPISVFINTKFGKKIRGYSEKQREYYGGYISWVFEMLAALRDIRMLGAVQKTVNEFEARHKKMFSVNIKSGISSLTAGNFISLVNLLIQLAIFSFAGILSANGSITIGLLTIVISFYGRLTAKLGNISSSYLDAQNRISYIQHIYDFLHTPTEQDERRTKELKISKGNITFENICFSYQEGRDILKNFSLNIPAGEKFALAGKSGSGKTTLAYMMLGFYRQKSGEITIDGQKLSECSLKSIRKSIGLISQDVLIFDGSIKENISLGKRNASDKEIYEVCRLSGLLDFVNSLPDKINTVIGSKGTGLSGGQKQRIAIARIYLKNPKIIIFDEATSALDNETETAIHDAWSSVLAGRTSIIIAHRQSSVMLCDKAAILENGRIISIGIPKAMKLRDNNFRELFAVKEDENYA